MAGPAYTGLLSCAAHLDQRAFLNEFQTGQSLGRLRQTISNGTYDRVAWLDEMTKKLNVTQFFDQGMARYARELILIADTRKRVVANRYQQQIAKRKDMQQVYDRLDPGWSVW